MGRIGSFEICSLAFALLWRCLCAYHAQDIDWSEVDQILEDAISDNAFPGCVAIVANKQGYLYATAKGYFTYGVPPPQNDFNPPVTLDVCKLPIKLNSSMLDII